jgi:hypothetical protein
MPWFERGPIRSARSAKISWKKAPQQHLPDDIGGIAGSPAPIFCRKRRLDAARMARVFPPRFPEGD